MPRALAHYPPREMAILGLIECTLSFAVIYTLIQTAGISAALPDVIDALPRGGIALAGTFTLAIGAIALTIGLYRPEVCLDCKRLLTTAGLGATLALAVLLAISAGTRDGLTAAQAAYVAKTLGAWLASVTLIRLLYSLTVTRIALSRRLVLLGDQRQVGILSGRLQSRRGQSFDPLILHEQALSWPLLRRQRIWGILVASEPDESTLETLLDCKLRGMRIFGRAAFHETQLGRIDLETLTPRELLTGRGFAARRLPATLKRLADIVIGTTMLILILPLMVLTAAAIKLDTKGSVFDRQQRMGQYHLPFTLLKFRTMRADAEAGGIPRWAQKQDSRITRVGRFIRATRIDELPQLVNVIRGEMSLVGPSPERPHFVEQLAQAIPFYRHRGYVKPGLTGWAQVNFPYRASVEDSREKFAYDLYYVKNRTIMLDMIILISTIRVVLFREGAR